MNRLSFRTIVGVLTLTEHGGAIVAVDWNAAPGADETPLLANARAQLAEYFAGARRAFDLPLAPTGSAFQRRVWERMLAIPYGGTETYGQVARALEASPRAVGGACGANRIPIIIPCHRILGANGLGGYSGGNGLQTKRVLLEIESGRRELPLEAPTAA